CRVPGAGCRVPGAGCRVPGAGCRESIPSGQVASMPTLRQQA
ncbi:peptide chain release factor 1, partial [Pseudomonas aeruginosa]|nr:peptide chain release factor 1 [Pseudomonas aeruginosa]